jgi:hypothetical protein
VYLLVSPASLDSQGHHKPCCIHVAWNRAFRLKAAAPQSFYGETAEALTFRLSCLGLAGSALGPMPYPTPNPPGGQAWILSGTPIAIDIGGSRTIFVVRNLLIGSDLQDQENDDGEKREPEAGPHHRTAQPVHAFGLAMHPFTNPDIPGLLLRLIVWRPAGVTTGAVAMRLHDRRPPIHVLCRSGREDKNASGLHPVRGEANATHPHRCSLREKHPEVLHTEAAVFVTNAIREAFPCPSE